MMDKGHNERMKRYNKTLGQFAIRLKHEELAEYKAAAERAGMSFRAWVLTAMDKAKEEAR